MRQLEPLIGEPLALDLVNTRPSGADLLGSATELGAWLDLERDRFPELAELAAPTPATLSRVVAIRSAVADIVDSLLSATRVRPAAVATLNAAQRLAPTYIQLTVDDANFALRTEYLGASDERLAARLAGAAAELFASDAVGKIRRCEAEDCSLVFALTHPKRRWCSAARCGNRVRVARYYQQTKSKNATSKIR